MYLPYDPTMVFSGKFTKHIRSVYEKVPWIPTCMVTYFTIEKVWNWPRCPTADDPINEMCMYIMQYYEVVRKNGVMTSTTECCTWKSLSQTQRHMSHAVFSYLVAYV